MNFKIRPQVLDKIRADHGYTSDQELADALGLAPGTVQRLRAGACPSVPTLVKILDVAGVERLDAGLTSTPAAEAA